MIEGWDPSEIIACAIRPPGSFFHMLTLFGFVFAAWLISPERVPAVVPVRPLKGPRRNV